MLLKQPVDIVNQFTEGDVIQHRKRGLLFAVAAPAVLVRIFGTQPYFAQQLLGAKFIRQQPDGKAFVDFHHQRPLAQRFKHPANPACILRFAAQPAFIRQPYYPPARAFAPGPAGQLGGRQFGGRQGVAAAVKLAERRQQLIIGEQLTEGGGVFRGHFQQMRKTDLDRALRQKEAGW